MNKELTADSSLITTIYFFLQLTTGPDPDCISFGAKQINPMGLVQPANAILYDFYNPGKGKERWYVTDQKEILSRANSSLLKSIFNAF